MTERFDPETREQFVEEQLVVPVDLTEIPMSIVIVEEIADVMLFAGKASMQRLARPAGLGEQIRGLLTRPERPPAT